MLATQGESTLDELELKAGCLASFFNISVFFGYIFAMGYEDCDLTVLSDVLLCIHTWQKTVSKWYTSAKICVLSSACQCQDYSCLSTSLYSS